MSDVTPMVETLQDLTTVKYMTGGGLALYVIKQLFELVTSLIKSKDVTASKDEERDSKESSREKIYETHRTVKAINDCLCKREEPFFSIKNCVESLHQVIEVKDSEGVPLIYNNGLKRSVDKLSHNVEHQARAIEKLSDVLSKQ